MYERLEVVSLQHRLLLRRDGVDLKGKHPVRGSHKLTEPIETDPLSHQVRDDPEIKRPLRQPNGFLNLEEHPIDMVHRFHAVHRRVTPDKSFAFDLIFLALVLNPRA